MKNRQSVAVMAGAMAFVSVSVQAAAVLPTYDSFGSLPQATFNGTPVGSGIPNHSVAITTYGGATLGLEAHQRYVGPDLADNNAGTYYANPGVGLSPGLSTWNFAYFIQGSIDTTGYTAQIRYDFDPAVGNDLSSLGAINVGPLTPVTTISDSQNLGFPFLNLDIPPFISSPAYPSFDPTASGEYTFAIQLFDASGGEVDRVSINVQVGEVGAPVPEPSTYVGALALAGLVSARLRRRK